MKHLRTTYIGHATLLLDFGSTRVLTDPNFDSRLGVILPRVTPPGRQPGQLPQLDAVVVTHAHADHLSFRSLDALGRLQHMAPCYAPPAVARWLKRRGYRDVLPLAPGETVTIGALDVTAAAAHHAGARYGIDRWRGAANMYLFDDGTTSCFFAGDTAWMPDSHHVVRGRLRGTGRQLDVALLPIGHAPWWKRPLFRRGHLTAADALGLFGALGARYFIPYHWGTFQHVTAGAFDGIRQLRRELQEFERRDDVIILDPGSSFMLDGVPR